MAGPLGSRISWYLQISPVTFLESLAPRDKYDVVVLSHCIYYFALPSTLPTLLAAIQPHTHTLCIAEWSLHSSSPITLPHVLAVLILSSIESKRNIPSEGNVRTVLSPAQIQKLIAKAGFRTLKQKIRVTAQDLLDAHWEVSFALRKRDQILASLKEEGVVEREIGALEAGYDALELAVADVEGGSKEVKPMDHWIGVFETV